jgi:GTP-binding protein
VSLRVTDVPGSTDSFNVAGRGEMSLSILIETMRREGYEFQVSPPRVLYQTIDGKKCEPIERWWWMCLPTAWAPSSKSWVPARPTCWR